MLNNATEHEGQGPPSRQPPAELEYRFGPFRFAPARQWLACGDTPIRLGGRALDILAVLLACRGEVVSKRELMARVWPRTVVEESNLKVQLSLLRRALGDGEIGNRYVATVNGRGYRFVAPVICLAGAGAVLPGASHQAGGAALPMPRLPAAGPVGRDELVAALVEALSRRRLLTLAGPPGIGKTCVARAVAGAHPDGEGCLVELDREGAPPHVAAVVAAALGLAGEAEPLPAILAHLRERRLLLVLDGCERVLDGAAALAELLAASAPGVAILVTSREPLRVPGEWVIRLPPLRYPSGARTLDALTAAEAMAYPAVRLFAERAAACREGYRLGEADALAVADICRRLEGLPLAIELAALRMDALGAGELAARLDQRLRLLERGRRGNPARHRNLCAALAWSYALLAPEEQALLRGLAVFDACFTLDTALALFAGAPCGAAQIVDGVASLVEKSLLMAEPDGAGLRYRMLPTVRAGALHMLEASGEAQALLLRHAELECGALDRLEADSGLAAAKLPRADLRW